MTIIREVKSESVLSDNIAFMEKCNDKQFGVGVCDPEYRDAEDNAPDISMRAKGGLKNWQGQKPTEEYFYHLFRTTKEQIIFGGNYFTDVINTGKFPDSERLTGVKIGESFLRANNNWFIWDKCFAKDLHYSMAEMAWVSIRKNIKIFKFRPTNNVSEWHETAKPMELYKYVFNTYIVGDLEGLEILDTNLGSGASRRAAWILGIPFTGVEIFSEFHEKEKLEFERFKESFGLFLPSKSNKKKKEEMKNNTIIPINKKGEIIDIDFEL